MRNSRPLTFFRMNDDTFNETTGTEEERELLGRRRFLKSMGKWSGAAIAAAVFGGAWLGFPPEANAGAWGQPPWRWMDQPPGLRRRRVDQRRRWRWGMDQPPGAMTAEVHGSIAGRRLYRTNLRAAVNVSISRVPAGCVVATLGPGSTWSTNSRDVGRAYRRFGILQAAINVA
jgi:hypothetical protein